MAISVVCEACGKKFGAPDSFAGKQVRCRGCGATLTVPGGDASPQLVPDGSESPIGGPPETGGILQPIAADDTAVGAAVSTGDGGDDGEERVPRRERKLRSLYGNPYMRLLDQWLPLASCVVGLLWTGFSISGETYQTAGGAFETIPGWIAGTRLASICLLYGALIFPLTLAGLRIAAKSMNIPMPAAVKWRLFASYVPSVTLAIVIWNAGGGATPALIFGAILGLIVSTACMAVLFRLEIEEIPLVAGHTGGGFALGSVISGVILYGINLATIVALTNGKSANPPPASPYWSGFDWESKLADMRAAAGAKAPAPARPAGAGTAAPGTPTAATPKAPTPEPSKADASEAPKPVVPAKPKNRKELEIERHLLMPVDGGDSTVPRLALDKRHVVDEVGDSLDTILRPVTPSKLMAVMRRVNATRVSFEVWNEASLAPTGTRVFEVERDSTAPIEETFALSPDGSRLAYITNFPRPSIRVKTFGGGDAEVESIGAMQRSAALIGFADDSTLLWRFDIQGKCTLERVSVTDRTKLKTIELPFELDGSGTSLAVSPTGKSLAIINRMRVTTVDLGTGALGKPWEVGPIGQSSVDPAPTGFAFSPDGTRVALYFESGARAIIRTFDVRTGAVDVDLPFQANPIPPETHPSFKGSTLEWWPNGKGWMLYGDAAIDPSGIVGRIDIHGVAAQSFVGSSTLDIVAADEEKNGRLIRVELDLPGK